MATEKRIIVVIPHGFCTGVVRAVDTARAALRVFGTPLYCMNEVVHNKQVVDDLSEQGVVFVGDLDQIPKGSVVLFSAHGVSPAMRTRAEQLELQVIDATCPFVAKVHAEVRRFAAQGYAILLVGHRNHEEIIGVRGEASESVTVIQTSEEAACLELPATTQVAVLTQTTLSVDEADRVLNVLRERFPHLETPSKTDICYATENRQLAVKRLAQVADRIIVLGSPNSSNSRRLVEVARETGCAADLVSNLSDLDPSVLNRVKSIGITSGASTPESFLDACVEQLKLMGFTRVEVLEAVREKTVRFPLPPEVR